MHSDQPTIRRRRSSPRRGAGHDAEGRVDDAFVEQAPDLLRFAYRAAYKVLGDDGRSEDIAQEAVIKAIARWEVVAEYASAWVTRVATNLAIDEWRRHRIDPADSVELPLADCTAEYSVRDELARALWMLPRRRREAIVLRFLCDFSPDQAAQAMGTSTAGVLKHTVRGLADLRQLLNPSPTVVDDEVFGAEVFAAPLPLVALTA